MPAHLANLDSEVKCLQYNCAQYNRVGMNPTPESDAPSSRIDDLLCFLVVSTGFAFNRLYRKPLEQLGLTYPQYLVMVALWEQDEATVGQICDRLRLDSGTISPILKRLVAMGMVSRQRSPDDERRVIVRLTAKGRGLQNGAEGVIACITDAVGLDPHDLTDLTRRIRMLRDNLDAASL